MQTRLLQLAILLICLSGCINKHTSTPVCSNNRRKTAYTSFRIQNEIDWNEAMSWCKDNREKAAMYALRGYNSFSNELEEVENILNIYPESPYIKLLARYINKLERDILTRYNHSDATDDTDDTSSFMQPSGKAFAEYERAQQIIKAVMNHPKVGDKDFWAPYHAHMSFLCKDYRQAAKWFAKVPQSDTQSCSITEYKYDYETKKYMVINNLEKALALYEQAATYFTDHEYKARALFMTSSCTMDLYAPNWWSNWSNVLDPDFSRSNDDKKVDSYFHQLKKSYSDTQFFKEAVHECKYFEYYVKTEL